MSNPAERAGICHFCNHSVTIPCNAEEAENCIHMVKVGAYGGGSGGSGKMRSVKKGNCGYCDGHVINPCTNSAAAEKCIHRAEGLRQQGEADKSPRRRILETAIAYTCGDRQVTHGRATDNFQVMANLWNAYIGGLMASSGGFINLTPRDTAVMMTLAKIARIAVGNPKERDHYIDAAAYMAIAAECEDIP